MATPVPRGKQRLGGLLLAAIGAAFTAWSWHTALNEGYFYMKAALTFPSVLVVGLALIAIPGYTEERHLRGEDVSQMEGWRLITARWWAVMLIAGAASAVNFLALHLICPF
jgi:hypothetical protein